MRAREWAAAHVPVLVLMLADTAALIAAVVGALMLRFDGRAWPSIYGEHLAGRLDSLAIAIGVYLTAYRAFRLYRYAWRFAGLETLLGVVYANTIGLVAFIIIGCVIDGGIFPRSVLVLLWAASIVFVGGVRVMLRILSIAKQREKASAREAADGRRAVILGAGSSGARIVKAINEDRELPHEIVGILDDDPRKKNTYIGSAKVLGPVSMLRQLAVERVMDEVIVALPDVSGRSMREHIMECRVRKIPVKAVPRLREVLFGAGSLRLTDFSVEDLLRRPPTNINVADMGAYLAGRRVMVTGAGGSIGSELCRQISALEPDSLILLGHGENSIHRVYNALMRDGGSRVGAVHCAIASVSRECRLRQVFERYKPEVVFHAAAHKHLPMMEINEREAVHNNVLGTSLVAEMCGRFGVERMVVISTDKAAAPCSVMGATKWLCEQVARAAAAQWPETKYVTVRFGNVLGSRGSVVHIFREQIRRGGPVTVTHPEMTRYFMTIPEAATLVLQAGAVGKSGELYLLDMGRPVKILDLAKDMIRLSGCEPGVDIQIAFSGIRPGERLHELLVSPDERIEPTRWEGLSIVRRPEYHSPAETHEILRRLEYAADHASRDEVRAILSELVSQPPPRDTSTLASKH